jgi:hypothetical protein
MLDENIKIFFLVKYAYFCVLKYKERNEQITIEHTFFLQSVFTATRFGAEGSSWLLEHIKRSIHVTHQK